MVFYKSLLDQRPVPGGARSDPPGPRGPRVRMTDRRYGLVTVPEGRRACQGDPGRAYGFSFGRSTIGLPWYRRVAPSDVICSTTVSPSTACPSTYFRPLMKTRRSAGTSEYTSTSSVSRGNAWAGAGVAARAPPPSEGGTAATAGGARASLAGSGSRVVSRSTGRDDVGGATAAVFGLLSDGADPPARPVPDR